MTEKKVRNYQEALIEAQKKLQASQKAALFSNEKARRLSELLETAEKTADLIKKENNILVSNIATLQTGIHTITDDEIKKQMTVLYHELEQWIVRNFGRPPPNTPEDSSSTGKTRLVERIQSDISVMILRELWTGLFIGCGVQDDAYMIQITDMIKSHCELREVWASLCFMFMTDSLHRSKPRFEALAVCYKPWCD